MAIASGHGCSAPSTISDTSSTASDTALPQRGQVKQPDPGQQRLLGIGFGNVSHQPVLGWGRSAMPEWCCRARGRRPRLKRHCDVQG
jgi:hypothetical protein